MANLIKTVMAKVPVARKLLRAYWQVHCFPTVKNACMHSLPGKLVVSLTSYPGRFSTLHLTLRSILDQTRRPDEVQLWIAHDDEKALTPAIKALTSHGLKILLCDDTRSYKKIIPALARDPQAFILTVDDDCFYPTDLIETLSQEFDPTRPTVNCRRAHIITRNEDGSIRPYLEWRGNIDENTPVDAPRGDMLSTGHGGVLYFPGCFDPEVKNVAAFREICPNADDIWLYWMARRAGTRYRKVGGKFISANWRGSQEDSLMATNVTHHGNDAQIAGMIERYGMVDLD